MRFEQLAETGGNAQALLLLSRTVRGCGELRDARESCGGAAETAGDIEKIAGPRAGAEKCFSARHCAGEDDVSDRDRRFGEVAASQGRLTGLGEGKESVEKAVEPALAALCVLDECARQAQGQKRRDGTRTHGGQVAEAAGEGAMADAFGRVPIEAEMTVGDGEVGGYGKLFSGPQTEQGAIVTDTNMQSRIMRFFQTPANFGQQSQLAWPADARNVGRFGAHFMRIGHDARSALVRYIRRRHSPSGPVRFL